MSTAIPRSAFALADELVYLNHAAIGVLPTAARDAIVSYAQAHTNTGVIGVASYEMRLPEARTRLAKFVGCDAGGVAFLRNTSEAVNILARGLRLQAGDEILTNDNEFGSNAYPWLALRDQGVTVRFIETAKERLTPAVLQREIRSATKVVALSWVSFIDGYRHDIAPLAEIAHRHGAKIAVDVIQGLGAAPFDMRALGVDAIYGGAQKWLLAEPGLGFLCLDLALIDEMHVHLPGWLSVEDVWNFLDYTQPWAAGAKRFEGGTPNLMGIFALLASLEVLESAGLAAIESHIRVLTDHLRIGLLAAGAQIVGMCAPQQRSGIVTFMMPGRDPLLLGAHLAAHQIVTTNRSNGIRVSPHGYNTVAEIDRLLHALKAQPA